MATDLRIDQELALVIASGSPAVASDQLLVLAVEQRLVPATISTYCDQLLALLVEVRGIHGVLSTNFSTVVGNGVAQAVITALVVNANGIPQAGVHLVLTQDRGSVITSPSQVTDVNGNASWTVTDTDVELVTFSGNGIAFSNTVAVQFTACNVSGTVYSQQGSVVAGAQVYAATQGADVSVIPPKPLLSVYADAFGQQLVVQPILSDGLGRYSFYADSRLLDLMIVYGGTIKQVYLDQESGKPPTTYHSLNWWVKSTTGMPVPGAQVFVLDNNFPNVPSTLYRSTPAPQVQLFSDAAGLFTITQPLLTDGFGYANSYALAGVYTLAVYLQGALQQIYPDQSVGGAYAGVHGRYDGWVRNAQGIAWPNSRVLVSLQPCVIPGALVPEFPSNLAHISSDANDFAHVTQSLTYDANNRPIIQSIITDGFGHFSFYAQPNTPYTLSVYNQYGVLMYTLPDQVL